MLDQCWASVADGGPTLTKRLINLTLYCHLTPQPSPGEPFTQFCFNVGHRFRRWVNIETPLGERLVFAVYVGETLTQCWIIVGPGHVLSYKLRYIVGFGLVEMAISPNPKPTIKNFI